MDPSRTTVDQSKAARVPIEIRVSIVADKCRALSAAARWKGHPLQRTTGVDSASPTHSQPENRAGGTIASTTSGDERTAPKSRRTRYERAASCSRAAAAWSEAW